MTIVNSSPATVPGWVRRQTQRSTEIVCADDTLILANQRPDLIFGTPVVAHPFNRLRDGVFDGEITGSALPVVDRPDKRPLAIIDEANFSGLGEPEDISSWRLGAVRLVSLGIALDLAGRQPFFAVDPLNRRSFRQHPPSERALAVLDVWHRHGRWVRPRPRDWGLTKNCADHTALTTLRDNRDTRDAILITGDGFLDDDRLLGSFPQLLDADFAARIHHPQLLGDTISIPTLGISYAIPPAFLKLFQ